VVPEAPLDLVDADGDDPPEVPVREAPLDGHLDGAADVLPARVEHLGDLLPGEALGPGGQKPAVAVGQLTLAVGPGEQLDGDAAARAIHSPPSVDKEDDDLPERHELKEALAKVIVRWPRLAASGAEGLRVRSRSDLDRDGGSAAVQPAHLPVDKTLVPLDPIYSGEEALFQACMGGPETQRGVQGIGTSGTQDPENEGMPVCHGNEVSTDCFGDGNRNGTGERTS